MIGAGWIPRRRPDPAIFLADKIDSRQLFIAPKPPRDSGLFMQIFGERFRQAVGERLGQDRVVVIMLMLEFFRELVGAMNRNGKTAEVICRFRIWDLGFGI